jgi:hypothetical protein
MARNPTRNGTSTAAVATATPTPSTELLPWEEFTSDVALTPEEIEENKQALAALSNLENVGGAGGMPLLGVSKDGSTWKLGVEGLAQEEGTLIAIDTRSARHGWVLWVEGKPTEVMVSAFETKPARPAPQNGLVWKDQVEFTGVILSGPEKGSPFRYSISSVGGLNAFTNWKNGVKKHGAIDPGHPHMVAGLYLDGYQHKTYGWTVTPEFRPRSWVATGLFAAALAAGGNAGPEILPPQKPTGPEKRQRPGVTIDNAPAGNRRPRTREPGAIA